MNDLTPFAASGDVLADDLLLDHIAGRGDVGGEPVAALLSALATHADTPLPARTGRRRIANKHRYLGAFAALAVAASGAGVAAAVTLPDGGSLLANRDRIEQRMEESARNGAPSALLSRLGLPATNGTTASRGLVLARGANGTFVLLPVAAVAGASAGTPATAGGTGGGAEGTADGLGAASGGAGATGSGDVGAGGGSAADAPVAGGPVTDPAAGAGKMSKDKTTKPGKARPGAATGNSQGANGQGTNGQGANGQGANGQGTESATGQTGSDPAAADPSTGTDDPADTTVTGPATTDNRLADPPTQRSVVSPPSPPGLQAGNRAVVPGAGPSVRPGAARPTRPTAPQATHDPAGAASAVAAVAAAKAAAKAAAAAAAAAAQAAAPLAPTP